MAVNNFMVGNYSAIYYAFVHWARVCGALRGQEDVRGGAATAVSRGDRSGLQPGGEPEARASRRPRARRGALPGPRM